MEVGRYTAKIEENDLRSAGTGTEFVFLKVSINGETMPVQIWLSDKSINMARGQLKVCGFEFGKDKLATLLEDKYFLAGREIPVEVYEEEYRDKVQLKCRITTNEVSKKRAAALDKMLEKSNDPEEDDIPF